MKRLLIVAGLALLMTSTGCAVSDMLFGAFGSHYSGGGETRAEREYHYNQQISSYGNSGY
ncbi:hypothetical protein [Bremerella cremea]|uniref:hypothetical protein n=1 Tax=Bremerella cremea TaxID=1031537 RepID=UPI0031E6D96C